MCSHMSHGMAPARTPRVRPHAHIMRVYKNILFLDLKLGILSTEKSLSVSQIIIFLWKIELNL
jgi:hypothetical protein